MWLYVYTVCVHAGQWPVGWGALAFDLELRGQAADGQPAGHFHLKDPKDPSAHPHTHTTSKIPSFFTCISFSPGVDGWMVYECGEATAIHFSLTGGLMERSTLET